MSEHLEIAERIVKELQTQSIIEKISSEGFDNLSEEEQRRAFSAMSHEGRLWGRNSNGIRTPGGGKGGKKRGGKKR